ncbi:MAG: hypothetical protein QM426_02850 [Euryarchaeota archaeon]|nr:hypothetical protein [Euryarchaeota archaeon]
MENKNKTLTYFTLLWGVTYLAFGSFQVLKGFGLLPLDFISQDLVPPEIAGGLVLVIVSAVYLYGTIEFSRASFEGKAYAYVGIVLSLLFGGLYFLTFIADLINAWVLAADGFEEWTPISGIKPALYLGLLSLIVYAAWEKTLRLQD